MLGQDPENQRLAPRKPETCTLELKTKDNIKFSLKPNLKQNKDIFTYEKPRDPKSRQISQNQHDVNQSHKIHASICCSGYLKMNKNLGNRLKPHLVK